MTKSRNGENAYSSHGGHQLKPVVLDVCTHIEEHNMETNGNASVGPCGEHSISNVTCVQGVCLVDIRTPIKNTATSKATPMATRRRFRRRDLESAVQRLRNDYYAELPIADQFHNLVDNKTLYQTLRDLKKPLMGTKKRLSTNMLAGLRVELSPERNG